jgi:uncharacterized protein YjeT (DUF2065 family)
VTEHRASNTTNEQADATARIVGVFLLCLGLGIAYFLWPSGVLDTTLGAMTFGALIRVIGSVAIGLGALVVAAMFWM